MPKLLKLNKILVALCLTLIAVKAISQQSDWNLVASKQFVKDAYEKKRQVTYLFAGKNAFVKYNPLSLVFGGLLFVYQKSISTQIGSACPYDVNCSNFSKLCIQKYGLLKGIPLTADRLTRCTKIATLGMVDGVDYSSKRMKLFDDPNDYSAKTK